MGRDRWYLRGLANQQKDLGLSMFNILKSYSLEFKMKMFLPLLLLINLAFAGFPPPIQKPLSATVGAIPLFANVLGSKVTELPVCTSGQFVGSNGSAFICGTPSGTVSAALSAADAATVYVTDVFGNTFSRWTGVPTHTIRKGTCVTTIAASPTCGTIDGPAGTVTSIESLSVSPTNKYIAMGRILGSETLSVYKISGDNITVSVEPGTRVASACRGVGWSTDGQRIVCGRALTPWYSVVKKNTGDNDLFTSLVTPFDVAPTGIAGDAKVSSLDLTCIAHETTPFQSCYTRSGDAYSKQLNNATLPAGNGNGNCFSKDGLWYATVNDLTPFFRAYAASGSGLGAVISSVTGTVAGTGNNCAWSSDGTYLAIRHAVTPFLTIFKRTGTSLTALTSPTPLLGGTNNIGLYDIVTFSPDDAYLIANYPIADGTVVYSRSADTFTSIEPTPTLKLDPDWTAFEWSKDGRILYGGATNLDKFYIMEVSNKPAIQLFKPGF